VPRSPEAIGECQAPGRQALSVMKEQNLGHGDPI
jgi:hypothetical protein